LEKRLLRHNKGRNISTKAYIPWELRWWKEFETRSQAIKVEIKLKKIKKRIELEKHLKGNDFRGVARD
jgi:putative endonuclease